VYVEVRTDAIGMTQNLPQSYYFMETSEFRLRWNIGRVHSHKPISQWIHGPVR